MRQYKRSKQSSVSGPAGEAASELATASLAAACGSCADIRVYLLGPAERALLVLEDQAWRAGDIDLWQVVRSARVSVIVASSTLEQADGLAG